MRSLLSAIYAWIIRRRNRRFDVGRGVHRVDVPVFSIGNLSVGGSGKTPVVAMIVRELHAMGHRPAIVSRGYGRRSRGLVIVSDAQSVLADASNGGDECCMLAHMLPGTVVIASELRYHGATRAIREYNADCIVLDDGFQHRQLGRDLDIVIIDRATLDQARVMPAGILREDLREIRRADFLLLRDGVQHQEIASLTTAAHAHLQTVPISVRMLSGRTFEKAEPVFAFCAIAQPERFLKSMEDLGIDSRGHHFFRDHLTYNPEHIQKLCAEAIDKGCRTLLCTEKDAVKVELFKSLFDERNLELAVLQQTAVIEPTDKLRSMIESVFSKTSNHVDGAGREDS